MMAYDDLVLATPGLVSYWRLDEVAGPAVVDGRSGYDGTVGGSPAVTFREPSLVAESPGAMGFHGGGAVTIDTQPAALGPGDTWTIEAWFRMAPGAGGPYDNYIYRWRDYGHWLKVGGGTVRGGFYNSSGTLFEQSSLAAMDDGAPHHVVLTKLALSRGLYIDGEVQAFTSSGSSSPFCYFPVGGGIAIGKNGAGGGGYFNGEISDVAVYAAAFSEATVQAHYKAGAARNGWAIGFIPIQ